MARRRRRTDLSRTFRRDPLLQEFYLDGILPTGETLGVGSYGSVVEVQYQHVTCAAKQMHELLLDPCNEGVRETVEKYQRECQLMASLRHPNITQFLGLCFLEGSPLPLLVMERLEMSVDDLLECAPNIPLPVKLSILTDTCSGLAYLHGRKTPVVHRDLTARNVLLTSSFSAKIADLGNSRIVSLTPGQLVQTLTKTPGTTVYMAPEALSDSHRYGPSLDVFSFGHLCLYILTEVFPGDLLAATQADPDNPGRVIGRTELERRDVYMKKLEGQFSESHPGLVQLVSQCLDNDPLTRPASEEIQGRLQDKKKEIERIYGGHTGAMLNIGSILAVKDMKSKDNKIKELQDSEARLEADVEDLIASNTRLEADKTREVEEKNDLAREKQEVLQENNQLKTENDRLQTDNRESEHERMQLETENINLARDITCLQSEKNEFDSRLEDLQSEKHELECRFVSHLKDLQSEKHELESHLEDLESVKHELESRFEDQQQLVTEKESLEELVEQLKRDLQSIKTSHKKQSLHRAALPHNFSKKLKKWRKGPDMPNTMGGNIQAVEIEGTVYVGGGNTSLSVENNSNIVMAYDMQSSQWLSLPPYSARYFSMTVINYKLVLVGGYCNGECSRELGVWQTNDRQWTQPFPPMPTARIRASSTYYKHWLVVVGGYKDLRSIDTVEVWDVITNQWSTGPSTPTPYEMNSVVIENTLYLMGGSYKSYYDVYSASMEAIVTAQPSQSSSIWQKLAPLNSKYSCPFNIRGALLTVGGLNKDNEPTSAIMRYSSETSTWVPAGELPQALHDCTCISLADKIYVFGGNTKSRYLKDMYYHTY